MNIATNSLRSLLLAITLTLSGVIAMTTPASAQTQPTAPTVTGVLVFITAKSGVNREQIMAVLPAEIRATTQLYLDGKIREWYSRGDGRGVIILVDTKDVAEAHSLIDSLPLSKTGFMDHEYIPVGPLMPLRLLLNTPSATDHAH
ncbi:hypothetical protein ACFPT7_00550 [Acidicapsa dinghuensis]|uniref:Muconolactone isomerase domain-containing protein n=1 Tax=Acidicapsa dinghuensis TaxID=2218256 RepID=A0ABW1E9V5_9BACT|nr:hypothetical protein [Acidicapsa dinghuensis]